MELFKPGLFINFMGQRKIWLTVSGILCALSLVAFFVPGLNLGTDFKGGTEVEVAFKKAVTSAQLRKTIQSIGFSKPDVIKVEDDNNKNRYLLRVQEVSAINAGQRVKLEQGLCFVGPGGKEPAADVCPVGAILKKRIGYAVPIGERKFDHEPIGSDIEKRK